MRAEAAKKVIAMPCIYALQHVDSGRLYIGQSTNVRKRWSDHKVHLRRGSHGNAHLQRSWNKYGERAFTFIVLLECSKEQLTAEEQRCINTVPRSLLFNIQAAQPSTNRGMRHTKAALEKMSKARRAYYANNPLAREQAAQRQREVARSRSPEVVQKWIDAIRTPAVRAKIAMKARERMQDNGERIRLSQAQGGRPIWASHLDSVEVLLFDWISQVKDHGFNPSSVCACLKGRFKQHHGYEWGYQ